ncbi:PGAP1-like alpha/beta domain-containing protein [Uliginosibacterium sp. H1]|uniref:PGAP1-like alpha/beta domain-containing protein n=1 Tax=Uliginosibacterium sp. H1 TaxID=3114757 RepID=UPI002E196FE9|nr:hypothetical protein [Uliginosibacterium sp. H1]
MPNRLLRYTCLLPPLASRPAALLLLALCSLTSACTLVRLREEAAAIDTATVLVGTVQPVHSCAGPIQVLALDMDDRTQSVPPGPHIAHHTRLFAPGGYELIVPRGRYTVLAFCDANDNLRHDPGEDAGWTDPASPLAASGDGVIIGNDLTLAYKLLPTAWAGLQVPPSPFGTHSARAGAIAALDTPAFSAEQGVRGYWAPLSFYRELGGNIYFLEPYDPKRIPVLFIHGAAGSPQDWRDFFSRLDRSRYQAWFFYYPSGTSLESTSNLLYWKLYNLQAEYSFQQVVFTAHSMGGLVARDFLTRHATQLPFSIPLFVSLSTPWAGEARAESGVRNSPAAVPSWYDMRPEGPFLQGLFQRPLPDNTRYYLFFGHQGSPGLFRPNNDGAVTLESQLRTSAQDEARMTFGFNEDHTSILRSAAVFERYAAVLKNATGAQQDGNQGNVQVTLLDAAGTPFVPAEALLQLEPEGAGGERLTLSIGRLSNAKVLGPIPTGRYRARAFSYGYATDTPSQSIEVRADQTLALQFRMRPQGVLWGFIGRPVQAAQRTPAGYLRPADTTVSIRRITLSGAGVQRVLTPSSTTTADSVERYLAGQDEAQGPHFSFVGLPAGDYELLIEAEGYAPSRTRHRVTPGQVSQNAMILLNRS